jgi:hypothetical protein
VKSAFLPQFSTIELQFVRKDYSWTRKIVIFPQVSPKDAHSMRKGCSGTSKNKISGFVTRPKERKTKKARERQGGEKGERERRE